MPRVNDDSERLPVCHSNCAQEHPPRVFLSIITFSILLLHCAAVRPCVYAIVLPFEMRTGNVKKRAWRERARENLLQRNGNHVLMRGSWSMERTNELHQPTNQPTESNEANRVRADYTVLTLCRVAGGARVFLGCRWRWEKNELGKCGARKRYYIFWLLEMFEVRTTAVIT